MMIKVIGLLLAVIMVAALFFGVILGVVCMVVDMVDFYLARREYGATLMPLKEFILIYDVSPEKWVLEKDGAHRAVRTCRNLHVAFKLRDYFGYKMFLVFNYLRESRELEKAGEETRKIIVEETQAEIERIRAKAEKEEAPPSEK